MLKENVTVTYFSL